VAAAVVAASAVHADTVTLRWRHAAPARVAGFRVHFGKSPDALTHSIDLHQLRPDAAGIFRARVELPDGEPVYVAVSAYDASGAESQPSKAWLRSPGISAPGRPAVVDP
jgi:hypothetical protein